jgi:surfeit locus 1 family protein
VSDRPQALDATAHPRGIVGPTIAALVALLVLVGLGTWQVNRLHWKEALIARVDARLGAAPVPAPAPAEWSALDLAEAEYAPVTVTGAYRNDREIHVVGSLTEPKGKASGYGYFIFTPFVTDAGWTVFVNRGFVPEAKRDAATRASGQIEGETTVTGLLRRPHLRSWFMPADLAEKNEWFSRDPALFAAAEGLNPADVAPYLIDSRFEDALPDGLPQGGETIVSFPNSHLQYAVTWYGLAAALVGVYAVFMRGRLRRR